MRKSIGKWGAALVALSLGLVADVSMEPVPGATQLAVVLSVDQAHAAPRHVARRTSRRTARRVVRRRSIAGCTPYRAYYNCGGVYYRAVVENGATVYVVVNP
ncbi:hypothetical protein [Stappia sp.]|uniref:hypothetical protein n=1 Tax=Stappia sp. TaxID=1870903 RepID=UPI003A997A1D